MKNIYGLYKQSRNASWQLLIDSNIRSLPVSVTAISKSANIHIIKNSTVNELQNGESGVSIIRNDKWYIIYDDTTSKQRARYTIAHELGHIFLGHPLKAGYHARIIDVDRPEAEWQAERFAAGLLALHAFYGGLGFIRPKKSAIFATSVIPPPKSAPKECASYMKEINS